MQYVRKIKPEEIQQGDIFFTSEGEFAPVMQVSNRGENPCFYYKPRDDHQIQKVPLNQTYFTLSERDDRYAIPMLFTSRQELDKRKEFVSQMSNIK